MPGRVLIAAASCALLAGCYTVDSVRESAPARSGEIAGDYRNLAACLTRAVQRGTQGSMVVDESTQTATVLSVTDNGYTRVPYSETTLRSAGPGRTQVDIRSQHRSLAGRPTFADAAWDNLQSCSQQAAAQGTPSQR